MWAFWGRRAGGGGAAGPAGAETGAQAGAPFGAEGAGTGPGEVAAGFERPIVRLRGVQKTYWMRGMHKTVLRSATMDLPRGRSIALLGRNGAGKSTFLGMLSGAIEPDRGEILIDGSVSWPVGFAGSFHADLSGEQNVRFLARVYGMDTEEVIAFVEEFAELGAHFHQPIRSYSSGMRARLGFGLSMAMSFDLYLVDEVTAVGDAAFRSKSEALFRERMESSSALYVSHSTGGLRKVCDAALVLENGVLRYFDDLSEGIAQHERNMKEPPQGARRNRRDRGAA